MDFTKFSKSQRLLFLYNRLLQGETLETEDIANKFAVDKRTYQRDINELKAFFADAQPGSEIEYVKNTGHRLARNDAICLTREQVMVLAKILLESRAFPHQEMEEMLDKLLMLCDPDQKRVVKDAIDNEKFHYHPVKHGKVLFQRMWELNQAIREKRLVDIEYLKVGNDQPVQRTVEPLAIMFSEFYFYLIANRHKQGYQHPAIYRLDRIESYTVRKDRFRVPYANRFEEGEFRKQVQFMHAGDLMNIRFIYRGNYLEAILDRLPTARVIQQKPGEAVLEAKVFGPGVLMWFLSQGDRVEVLSPLEFREDIKNKIQNMLARY